MPIVIFDPEQHAAVRIAGACYAPDVDRVDDVAEVQVAVGAGAKRVTGGAMNLVIWSSGYWVINW